MQLFKVPRQGRRARQHLLMPSPAGPVAVRSDRKRSRRSTSPFSVAR